jgi:aryl-alcohol dehydrogenase-like predicted oxidoreductase
VPAGSRAELEGYDWLRSRVTDAAKNECVGKLEQVAHELGCSVGQLAIAWVLKNPNVSTVITGASRVEQIAENMKAIEVAARITPDLQQRIEDIVVDMEQ